MGKGRFKKVPLPKIEHTPEVDEETRRLQRDMPHNEWIWSVDSKPAYTDTERYQIQVNFAKLYYEMRHMGRAAHYVGISIPTLRSWMDGDPVFKRMIDNVHFAFNDDANAVLLNNIRSAGLDPRAQNVAAAMIKNTFDPEFRSGKIGKGGGNIQVNVILGPDPDRPPRRLPSVTGNEIEVPDADDER